MSLRILARKMSTACSLIRSKGTKEFLSFCIRYKRQILWKWKAERYVERFKHQDLVLIENVNGFPMLVNPRDVGIGTELIYSRIHEPQASKLLPYIARPGDVVLECGANIGYYTLLLSKLVGEQGQIIALEPNPAACYLLRANLHLNRVTNVKVHELAVGNKDGTSQFYIRGAFNLSSMTLESNGVIETREVKVQKIDTLIEQLALPKLDLVRMDIEGYEAAALEGGIDSLRRFRPRLLIEWHKEKMGVELATKSLVELEKLGYYIQFCIPRDEDWPWAKKPARIFGPYTIDAFLSTEIWHAKRLFTYTLFLEPSSQGEQGASG